MRFGIIILVQRAIGFLQSWFASMLQRPSIVLRKEYTMKTMTTYMLPTTDRALLLRPILMDAPAGSTIATHVPAMYDLVMKELQAVGRLDIEVCLLPRDKTTEATPDGPP
jgi:hypothetical protein